MLIHLSLTRTENSIRKEEELLLYTTPHKITNMAEKPAQAMFQLTDKVAVITGGTGTLGSCMALGLAQAGATVVVLGRNATSGEKVVARITEAGGTASFIACDVLVEADLKAANEKILTDLKKVCDESVVFIIHFSVA